MTSVLESDTVSRVSAFRSTYKDLPSELYIPGIEGVKRNVTVKRAAGVGEPPSKPAHDSGKTREPDSDVHVTERRTDGQAGGAEPALGGRPRSKLGPIVRGGDENDAALVSVSQDLRTYVEDVKLMSFVYVHHPLQRFRTMRANAWFVTGVPDDAALSPAQVPKLDAEDGPLTDDDTVDRLFYLVTNAESRNELIVKLLPETLTFGLARDGTWRMRNGVYESLLSLLLEELPALDVDATAIAPPKQMLDKRHGKSSAPSALPHHVLQNEHIVIYSAPAALKPVLPSESAMLDRLVAAGLAMETGFSSASMPCWVVGEAGTNILPGEGKPGAPVPASASEQVPAPYMLSKQPESRLWFLTPATARGAVFCENLAYLIATELPGAYEYATGTAAAEALAGAVPAA
jgi:hypothetical protein